MTTFPALANEFHSHLDKVLHCQISYCLYCLHCSLQILLQHIYECMYIYYIYVYTYILKVLKLFKDFSYLCVCVSVCVPVYLCVWGGGSVCVCVIHTCLSAGGGQKRVSDPLELK